jgi:hypothetical protein
MAILLIIIAAIALVVGLVFWATNRWSSPSRDRAKTAPLRNARQTAQTSTTPDRGTGIN